MVFSSSVFLLLFLPTVFILNFFIDKKYSNLLLVLASLFFYAWGEPILVLVMCFSILINFAIGELIFKSNLHKKHYLVFGLLCNLGVLFYYKYTIFFISILNSLLGSYQLPVPDIALPIGISFFTFQGISYIVDIYRNECEPTHNIINTALYISFFPQLIAGPIVKYRDINFQLSYRTIDSSNIVSGFKRFIYGLSKKVLISNTMGLCVDTIHSMNIASIDTKATWICSLAYTLQIYYDFSGYSDMAIGLGKIFGFNIPENFNYPYLSKSITEFWRRWHISLGTWFREYIYIPLGGNRRGEIKTIINLIIVFFLTGLWHGAQYTFILWGLYNVFFVILEKKYLLNIFKKHRIISAIYCMFVVNIGWVLFRSESVTIAIQYLTRMFIPLRHKDIHLPTYTYIDNRTIVLFFIGIAFCGIHSQVIPARLKSIFKNSITESICCTILFILCLSAMANNTYNPFIYFQF